MTDIYAVVAVVASFVIGLIVSKQYYKKFKNTLHKIRNCIDSIDSALQDDKITKEEIQQIVNNCKKILEDLL